jgi:type IV pilus assembly protein PilM
MMGWTRRGRTPIGIDAGGEFIKAAQLAPVRHGGWKVTAAAVMRRAAPGSPIDAGEAVRLREALDRQGFEGDRVALAAPSHKLMTEVMDLPPRGSGAPLGQIARLELARAHRRDPGTFEMGLWDVPRPARSAEGASVFAAALAHDDADPFLDAFEQTGLRPIVLDVPAQALLRACRPRLTDRQGITGVLDLGSAGCRLTLTYRHIVIYERAVGDDGLMHVKRSLAERFDLTPDVVDYLLEQVGLSTPAAAADDATPDADAPAAQDTGAGGGAGNAGPVADGMQSAEFRKLLTAQLDAVVKDVSASFDYAQHRYPEAAMDGLLLVGGGALAPGVSEYLGRTWEGKATPVAAGELIQCPDALTATCLSTALPLALGLAMEDGE